jgi:putative transposase
MKSYKAIFGSGDPKLPTSFPPDKGRFSESPSGSGRLSERSSQPGRGRFSEMPSPPGSGRSPDLPKKPKRNPKFSEGYHFITLVVNQRIPIFEINSLARLAIKALEFYTKRGDYELHGFVIMPDHIHFICNPQKIVSEIIRDIKKYISKYAIQYLLDKNSTLLDKFKLKKPRKRKHVYQIWQSDFYDFNIMAERKFQEKLRYMYENPSRKGLCDQMQEYEFSDVNRYFGSGDPKLPTSIQLGSSRFPESSPPPGRGRSPDLPKKRKE